MFSLDLNCTQDDKDILIADLWEQGSAGIVELSADRLRVFFEDDADAERLSGIYGAPATPSDDRDWVAVAQERLQPMQVGEKFFLVPQWRDDPTPAGRLRIEINNGMAFGTGAHESTRLCLQLLEEYVRPGMTVVDIGTGSGILALGAKLLGASRVFACDTDPLATEVAAGAGLLVFTGSAPAIRSGAADLVLANITPDWLTELQHEFPRILRAGGHAILSGIEAKDVAELPFRPIEIRAEAEWRAMVIAKQ